MLNGFTVYLYLVHQLPILAINNGRQAGLSESMIQSSGEIRTAMVLRLRLVCFKSRTLISMVHLGVHYVDLDQVNRKKVEGSTFIVKSHSTCFVGRLPRELFYFHTSFKTIMRRLDCKVVTNYRFFSTEKKCSLN